MEKGNHMLDNKNSNSEIDSIKDENPEKITYTDDYDYARDWWKYGWPGKIAGVISGVIAVTANLIRVGVVNLLLGKNEQLDIRGTFYRALGRREDNKNENKDNKSKNIKKDSEISKTSNAVLKKEEAIKIPDDIRDSAVDIMMADKDIQKIFQELGLQAEPKTIGEEIYLLKKDSDGLIKSSPAMSKQDLFNGNAENLASALYSYEKNGSKMECAIRAAIAIASIRYIANKEEFMKCQISGNPKHLSSINVKTEFGGEQIDITGSKMAVNAIDITLNGKIISVLPINEVLTNPMKTYDKDILKQIENNQKNIFSFGTKDRIILERTENGIAINCMKDNFKDKTVTKVDLGVYKFDTEHDVRELISKLRAEKIHTGFIVDGKTVRTTPSSLAYAIGVMSNPDMIPDRNKDGKVLNTFTGKPEPDGSPHIHIEHTQKGVTLKYFSPISNEDYADLGVTGYQSLNLLQENDVEKIVSAVKDIKKEMQSNEFICTTYNRNEKENDTKNDYFHVPVIKPQEIDEDTKRNVNFKRILNHQSLEDEIDVSFEVPTPVEKESLERTENGNIIYTDGQIPPGECGMENATFVVNYGEKEIFDEITQEDHEQYFDDREVHDPYQQYDDFER